MKLPRIPGRCAVSARARIFGWMVLLVALALLASVVATRAVLDTTLDSRMDDELAHETAKFRSYAENARAMDTRQLLTAYLQQAEPEEDETYFSIVDGRSARRVSRKPPARLDSDAAFVRHAAAARTPTAGTTRSSNGEVRYAVVPVDVADDPSRGALVVAEFTKYEAARNTATVRVLAIVGFGALLIACAIGWLIAGRVLAPVRVLRQTAERISSTELTRRIEVRGNDDIAGLARTFNTMLDRLEQGFVTQRRFLDDAGHELRTPITVIRGHLELMGENPGDRRETLALVSDELNRMRRVVEDLLLLAKSDQPHFLALDEVELADLTVGVVAKSRALGDRWWTVDAVAETTVAADAQRLTQALMQLTANAFAHTEPDDTVAVGSAVRGDRVLLWVRDTGAGLPAGDTGWLFDRFTRSEGRAPGSGAGLGLSIVRSIAVAHDGEIRVRNEPGAGAMFLLDLPLRATPDRSSE